MKAPWRILGFFFGVTMACGSRGTGTFTPATDSGTMMMVPDGGMMLPDTAAPVDTGVRPDTGARPDTGTPPTGSVGECGASVRRALCACGPMDMRCQNAAINADMGCVECLGANQQSCCPTEFGAINTCAMSAGCMDLGCVMSMCARQIMALQTCYNNRLQTEAMAGGGACVMGYIGCLGDIVTMGPAAVCR